MSFKFVQIRCYSTNSSFVSSRFGFLQREVCRSVNSPRMSTSYILYHRYLRSSKRPKFFIGLLFFICFVRFLLYLIANVLKSMWFWTTCFLLRPQKYVKGNVIKFLIMYSTIKKNILCRYLKRLINSANIFMKSVEMHEFKNNSISRYAFILCTKSVFGIFRNQIIFLKVGCYVRSDKQMWWYFYDNYRSQHN